MIGVLDPTQGNRWYAVRYRQGYWGKPFVTNFFTAFSMLPLGAELYAWMGANWAKVR